MSYLGRFAKYKVAYMNKSNIFQDNTTEAFLKGREDNIEEMQIGFVHGLFEMYKIRQDIIK